MSFSQISFKRISFVNLTSPLFFSKILSYSQMLYKGIYFVQLNPHPLTFWSKNLRFSQISFKVTTLWSWLPSLINSNYKREFKKNDFCNARQQILRQDVNDVFLDFSHRWKWPICLIAFIHSGNHHSHLQYFLKYSLHIINLQKYSRQNH